MEEETKGNPLKTPPVDRGDLTTKSGGEISHKAPHEKDTPGDDRDGNLDTQLQRGQSADHHATGSSQNTSTDRGFRETLSGQSQRVNSRPRDAKEEMAVNLLLNFQSQSPLEQSQSNPVASMNTKEECKPTTPQKKMMNKSVAVYESLSKEEPMPEPVVGYSSSSKEGPVHQSQREGEERDFLSDNQLTSTFPVKLYRALMDAKARGLTDVCSFMPSGATFRIHEPRRFMKEVAPEFFRQSKFPSFLRQLQMYGFERVVEANTVDCYAHIYFREASPDLLPKIKRRLQAKRPSSSK